MRRLRRLFIPAVSIGFALAFAASAAAGTSHAAELGRSAQPAVTVKPHTGPPWRHVYTAPAGQDASAVGVAAASASDAWVIGTSGLQARGFAVHWNGRRWHFMRLPVAGFFPVSVTVSRGVPASILGFVANSHSFETSRAYALRWTGHSWSVVSLPHGSSVSWVNFDDLFSYETAGSGLWVIGTSLSNGDPGHAILWNLTSRGAWKSYPLPVNFVINIDGSSPDNVWAVAELVKAEQAVAYRWNGSHWRQVAIPFIASPSVAVDAVSDVWIAGQGRQTSPGVSEPEVLHWNGHRWTLIKTPFAVNIGLAAPGADGGMWFGQWAHETGGRWYVPSSFGWPSCLGTSGGGVAAIPGTGAAWQTASCSRKSGSSEAGILINGKL
jgi:hypothetical protein